MPALKPISETASKRLPPAAIDRRSGKPKRIPKAVRHAITLMLTGEVTNIKAAAERAGLSCEHLSRTLAMPHVEVAGRAKSARRMSTAV